MTDKVVLNNVLGTYDVTRINDNFDKIEEALNERVLSKQGDSLKGDIDVNGKRLFNLPAPAEDSHPARLKDVKNAIAGLAGQTANLVGFTPQNGITSNNVQGAIEEVNTFTQQGATVFDKRLVADKLKDTFDIRDFGASTSKSAADNKEALNEAISAVNAQGGGVIEIKGGINYGYDTRTIETYPNFAGCASDITVIDHGYGTADGVNKAGAQTRVFFHTAQTTPAGMHDGNGYWINGNWHPYTWINNTANLKSVGDPSRTSADNRRASLFFGNDGKATWRMGQGSLYGDGYTDEELSNFVIEMFATDGSTLIDNAPLTIERKTGNWSIGGGTNGPQAAIHVKNTSLGYWQGIFESLTNKATVALRTSAGASQDVAIVNNDGTFAINIPASGNAVEVLGTNRYVGIGTTPSYKLDVRDNRASGFVLNIKNEGTVDGNVGILDSSSSGSSGWHFLRMFADNQTDQKFYMRGDGQAAADGAWASGGADYAEYFEWADGNPNKEDRRGMPVSMATDGKIKPAVQGEKVIGVISSNPSVVGDSAPMYWADKFLRDDYGTIVVKDGKPVVNPLYDPTKTYVSREFRPEWACVGLVGKLRVRVGQPVDERWIKLRSVSASVDEWLVR